MYRRGMSLKYAAVRESEGPYILPKVAGMKTEAHAYLSDDLYAASEENMWDQLRNAASYEGVIGAYAMPDVHLGYGIPVGCVVVTDNTIIQAGSGYDISCFTADTKVPLVDGRELTFKDLVQEYGDGREFYVYSIDPEGRVTAGRARNPRKTRSKAPLVEVSLDNGERITCTPDHRFMLRDGTYREARHLIADESLMPLYRSRKDGYCVGLSKHSATKHNNHKVVSVRTLNQCEDVYCLTVDKYENFALCAGVFVHNCGVLFSKTSLKAHQVRDRNLRERWITEVEKRIALGVGSSRPDLMPKFGTKKVDEILRYGAKALGVRSDLCERQYIPIPDETDLTTIERAYSKVGDQLGSVGGGNHFVEMQVDRDTGEVYVMVHCGSRGYGWQTADHFFYEGAKVRDLPKNRREDSWLRMDEQVGKDYWAHHNSAANFAVANRHIISRGVQEALQEVFQADSEVYYEISHNLVQQETLVLPDGTTKKGFVHRKGATRAFPAGHPDIKGTVWEPTGHPCLIPGSMYDGAAILFAKPDAHKSACSVNHGSGRKMARGEAKRKLEHQQERIDEEMRTVIRTFNGVQIEGIVGNHKHTPLDECGHVYKDLDEVLLTLELNGIAEVKSRLYPVCNLKGTD